VDPIWHAPVLPPRYRRVQDLLSRLISAGSADFFADACDIIERHPSFRTTTHLVGHLTRELEGEVLAVLSTLPDARRNLQLDAKARGGSQKKEKDGHRAKVDAIIAALGLASNPNAIGWRDFVGEGRGWVRDAHRDDLRSARRTHRGFEERFDLFVGVLDCVLSAAETKYAVVLEELDKVRREPKPTEDHWKVVEPFLGSGATAQIYFFESLPSGWLPGLMQHRAFEDPPDRVLRDDGAISFPSWPQASYLERVAAERPADVAAAIESIPVTDNERTHWLILRAALRMPAEYAAQVARKEIAWLAAHDWVMGVLWEPATELAAKLVNAGILDVAVELLRTCLDVTASKGSNGSGRGVKARVSEWEFDHVVAKALRPLMARAPDQARALLTALLDRAQAADVELFFRAVEDDSENQFSEPVTVLFYALRDVYEASTQADGGALRQSVIDLEAKGRACYARLALHLLRRNGTLAPDLVLKRATDLDLLDRDELFHELVCMIAACLPRLARDDVARVIRKIRDLTSEERLRLRFADQEPAWHAQMAALERRRWFAALGGSRPPDVEEEYRQLCDAHGGEPQDPTFTWSMPQVWMGPSAPVSAEQLTKLGDDELLTYIAGWKPPPKDTAFSDSRWGLGQELKKAALAEPVRFSSLARRFREMHQQYVLAVIWGLHESMSGALQVSAQLPTPELDWESLLELAEWAAQQATTDGKDDSPGNWTTVRQMTADLLEDASIIFARRADARCSRAWRTIRTLMADPNPTPEDLRASTRDDESVATNTVRGQGLQAAIALATELASSPTTNSELFAEVLAAILDRSHVDVEPAVAIRRVLAHRFNSLFAISQDAAKAIAVALFPTATTGGADRKSLWCSFLKWNRPTSSVFRALVEHYTYAVDALFTGDFLFANELGTHLVWLAAWGEVEISAPNNLLALFVRVAPGVARGHALADLGHALERAERGTVPGADVERLKGLWSWWEKASGATDSQEDLAAFGWWFSSPLFEPEWALQALARVLAVSAELDWEHEVATKLAALASSHPVATMECLTPFASEQVLRLSRTVANVHTALAALVTVPETRSRARTLAASLVARGFLEFRDIALAKQ
jgi:hypothetical protein